MSYEDAFLYFQEVTPHEMRGLRILQSALFNFEPLAKRPGLGPVVAERLVDLKLAEKGESDGYPSAKWGPGYKLSDLGWKVIERGSRPEGEPSGPKLRTPEPRLKPLDPRTKTRF